MAVTGGDGSEIWPAIQAIMTTPMPGTSPAGGVDNAQYGATTNPGGSVPPPTTGPPDPGIPGGGVAPPQTAQNYFPYQWSGDTDPGLAAALAAAGNPPEGSAAFYMIKYPASVWGGQDNVASGQAPQWLQDLVNQYKQNPSDKLWRHLMLGEGVSSQYSQYQMPDSIKQWLAQQLGGEPSAGSSGKGGV